MTALTDEDHIWPERLMIRDTKLHDDIGGAGQRIYTTAGQGYKKREYVRADLAAKLSGGASFNALQAAYLRGAEWHRLHGDDPLLTKAAYDYADAATHPAEPAVAPAGLENHAPHERAIIAAAEHLASLTPSSCADIELSKCRVRVEWTDDDPQPVPVADDLVERLFSLVGYVAGRSNIINEAAARITADAATIAERDTYIAGMEVMFDGLRRSMLEQGATIAAKDAALKAIDAMPYYTSPVPPEYVEGLCQRMNKALDIAAAALNAGERDAQG